MGSAIESLMGQMGGGGLLGPQGPMPSVLSSQMPQFQPPPIVQPKGPSMVDRLHERLSGLLDSVKPSAPQGYGGLLTDQEQQAAQPGRGASLATRILGFGSDIFSKDLYRQNMDNLVNMKDVATKHGEEARARAMRQQAETIMSDPNLTPEQQRQAITRLIPLSFAVGGKEIGGLANVLQALTPEYHQGEHALFDTPDGGLKWLKPGENIPQGYSPHVADKPYVPQKFINGRGETAWVRPGEPVPPGFKPWAPDKQDAFSAVTVTPPGADAPQVVPMSTKTGQTLAPLGSAKVTQAAGGAAGKMIEARAKAAVSEMNNAHDAMYEYEQRLKSKQVNIAGLSEFLGQIGSTFTHDDPASRAAQTVALNLLNKKNPDLARYIRRGLSFAEGESMISQRPSDYRTKMASFLSRAATGADTGMIEDIESRRNSIMTPLNEVFPKTAPKTTSKGSGSESGSKTPKLDALRHLIQP